MILETVEGEVRLEVESEESYRVPTEGSWTCVAKIAAGHEPFTMLPGYWFHIYDVEDNLISMSQWRVPGSVFCSAIDSLQVTYTQHFIHTVDGWVFGE